MARNKPVCPECCTFSLKCVDTRPTDLLEHELEAPRISKWECTFCGAEFQRRTPASTLTRIKQAKMKPSLIKRVLDYVGKTQGK